MEPERPMEGPDGPAEANAACAEARRLLAIFCRDRLSQEDDRRFRSHLTDCPECRTVYREAMASLARMGRAKRARRAEVARERSRRLAMDSQRPRRRRHGLRLILAPVVILVVIGLFQPFQPRGGMRIALEAGEVRVGDQELVLDAPVEPEKGAWCESGAEGRAVARHGAGEIAIGPSSYLLIEDPLGARLRLMRGSLLADGTAWITTPFGVLQLVDGEARLSLIEGKLELSCVAGELAWTGPTGRLTLEAGESVSSDDPSRPLVP